MFSYLDLQLIELCLMAQIGEIKGKLKFWISVRNYERIFSCRRSLKHFEELRQKVIDLANVNHQIEIKPQ